MASVDEYMKLNSPLQKRGEELKKQSSKSWEALGNPTSISEYLSAVGKLAAQQKAVYDSSQPPVVSQLWRNLNPATSIPDAIGNFYNASHNDDYVGMGVAAATGIPFIPAFKVLKAVNPLMKLDLAKSGARAVTNELGSRLSDYFNE